MDENINDNDGMEDVESAAETSAETEVMEEEGDAGFSAHLVEKAPVDFDVPGDAGPAEETVAAGPFEFDAPNLARDVDALLFISPEPVTLETLAEVTGAGGEELAQAVGKVRERFTEEAGGIVFTEVAGGYTFRTSDQARGAVERFCERPVDYSLSPAALETLAIIAYLQPVTRPEIARIRGVGADTVVNTLVDKGLLAEAGRHDETGAVRYRTTPAFEKLFGLAGLETLPAIEGFEATPEDVEELREKLHLAAEKRE